MTSLSELSRSASTRPAKHKEFEEDRDCPRIKEGAKEREVARLREKRNGEALQNAERMQVQEPISYGDAVQLLHVRSGKFVTVHPRRPARVDRQARLVEVR